MMLARTTSASRGSRNSSARHGEAGIGPPPKRVRPLTTRTNKAKGPTSGRRAGRRRASRARTSSASNPTGMMTSGSAQFIAGRPGKPPPPPPRARRGMRGWPGSRGRRRPPRRAVSGRIPPTAWMGADTRAAAASSAARPSARSSLPGVAKMGPSTIQSAPCVGGLPRAHPRNGRRRRWRGRGTRRARRARQGPLRGAGLPPRLSGPPRPAGRSPPAASRSPRGRRRGRPPARPGPRRQGPSRAPGIDRHPRRRLPRPGRPACGPAAAGGDR